METITPDNFTGKNTEGHHANQPLQYLTASSVIGDKVHDAADQKMGEIKDIMLNIATGQIDYYVVEFGGFLGVGVKYFAIPFRLLTVNPEKKIFCFNQKKELLEKAPGFDLEHWPDTNFHWEEEHWSFV